MNLFTGHMKGFGTTAIDDDGEEVLEEFQYEDRDDRRDYWIEVEEDRCATLAEGLFSETAEAWHNHFRSRTDVLNSMFASTLPAFNREVYDSLFASSSPLDNLIRAATNRRQSALVQRMNMDLLEFATKSPGLVGILNEPPKSATEMQIVGIDQLDEMGPSDWENAVSVLSKRDVGRFISFKPEDFDVPLQNIDRSTYAKWRQGPTTGEGALSPDAVDAMRYLWFRSSGMTKTPRQDDRYETIFRDGIAYYRKSREDAWTPIVPNAGVRSLLDGIASSHAPTGAIRSM